MPLPDVPRDMNRIVVIGSTSSGKTTLARSLSTILSMPHIELDAFRFLPQWQVRPNDEFRGLVDEATSQPRWVCDGNYSVARDLTWDRADTVIWLDYRLSLILWRLTRRTVGRTMNRTDLWNTGNRENILKHFRLSDESLYYWVFKTYWRRKRDMPVLMQSPQYAELRFIRLSSPRETNAWLAAVRDRATHPA